MSDLRHRPYAFERDSFLCDRCFIVHGSITRQMCASNRQIIIFKINITPNSDDNQVLIHVMCINYGCYQFGKYMLTLLHSYINRSNINKVFVSIDTLIPYITALFKLFEIPKRLNWRYGFISYLHGFRWTRNRIFWLLSIARFCVWVWILRLMLNRIAHLSR